MKMPFWQSLFGWQFLLLGALSLFHFFFPPQLWVDALVLAFFVAAAFLSPATAFAAVLYAAQFFERWLTLFPLHIGGLAIKAYTFDIALGIIVAAVVVPPLFGMRMRSWLAEIRAARQTGSRAARRLDVLILAWFVLISLSFAVHLGLGASWETMFSSWKNYAFYSLVYFVAAYFWKFVPDAKENQRRFLSVIPYAAAGLMLFPLLGFALGGGVWADYTPLSTEGTRYVAATHSFFISWYALYGLAAGWNVFAIGTLAAGLAAGLYRNVWLGVFAGAAVLAGAWLSHDRLRFGLWARRALGSLLVVVAVAAGAWAYYGRAVDDAIGSSSVAQGVAGRAQTLAAGNLGSDESSGWRLAAWEAAARQFASGGAADVARSLALGQGFGVRIPFSYQEFEQDVSAKDLHNDWLAVALQSGLLSVALLFAIAVSAFVLAWKGYRDGGDVALAWCAAAIASFCVAALFGTYFDINVFAPWFWIMAALVRSRV